MLNGPKLPGGTSLSLLALLGGQLLVMFLAQGEIAKVLVTRPEYLYLRVLPGLAWPLSLAWLFSAWNSRRFPGSTAVPLGFSLGTSLWMVSAVMAPLFRDLSSHGAGLERASNLAWSTGVALTLLLGLAQILMSGVVNRVLARWSGGLCLALGAAVSLTSISLCLPWMLDYPLLMVSGLIALAAFLPVGLPKPFGLSAAWLALGAGMMAQAVSDTYFQLPELPGSLLPNWEWAFISSGMEHLWVQPLFLTAAVPLLLSALARDLVLLGEIRQETERAPIASSLLGLGCLNILGALLGCGVPLGVLPGYGGYRRLGAGQIYAQGAGLLLLGLCLFGGFSQVIGYLPLPTLGVLAAGQLFLSAGLSLNRLATVAPRVQGFLLAAAWLPVLSAQYKEQALLLGLVWGGMAVAVQNGHFGAASGVSLVGCLLASTGVMHEGRWVLDFSPLSGAYLTLAIIFHLGYVLHVEKLALPLLATDGPRPPLEQIPPGGSSESLGKLPFDSPGGSRPAEAAPPGSVS